MSHTVTVTSAPNGVVTVRCDGRDFRVGEPVHDVDDSTVDALKATRGVGVDVAAEDDTADQQEAPQ